MSAGSLTLASPAAQKERQYELRVTASDSAHEAQTSVVIHVEDENDQPPVFTQPAYSAALLELTGPGVAVLTVSASDADVGRNANVSFSLVTPTDQFYMNPVTGVLYTNATVRFDPSEPVRQLVVAATDGGSPALSAAAAVRLRVEDINNHAPQFGRTVYKASISEAAALGQVILRVSAADVDESRHNRNIDYSFISGNEDGIFQIAR